MGRLVKDALNPNKLLKPEEAAELLSISKRELKQMRQQGDGPPPVKLGERTFRYCFADLMRFIEQRKVHTA